MSFFPYLEVLTKL
jgi:hypothetical protein